MHLNCDECEKPAENIYEVTSGAFVDAMALCPSCHKKLSKNVDYKISPIEDGDLAESI